MADNIQNNPNVQQAVNDALAEQKKKKKKKKLIIFAIIAVFVVLIIAVASSGSDDNSPKTEQIDGTPSSSQSSSDEDSSAPDKIKAGTAITVNDIKISYLSSNADFKKYSEYLGPQKGNKVVRAEFEFENVGSTDTSLDGFECYADGQKCEEYYGMDDYSSPTLESVSAGRTLKCVVYYEVPTSSKSVELEYEPDFWSSDKVVFVIE